ncbi:MULTISPECIES: TOBE domain-containing protein [unclassified Lebetimonas]|uniref:TOBE domain-containing protein n=1 Tax=unclassified Lebetimonas TaxID=2648158 RepID=UPI0004676B7B|nr:MULTISPECIES: TOBE domain-containing protein [unclassified Lebetimonas]
MNKIKADLINIENKNNINLLTFKSVNETIKVVMLEMNFEIKNEAFLFFKPTMVSLSKEKCKSTIENNLAAVVEKIEIGEIFTNIYCNFNNEEIEVLILKESFEKLNINIGERVFLMIRASEIGVSVD